MKIFNTITLLIICSLIIYVIFPLMTHPERPQKSTQSRQDMQSLFIRFMQFKAENNTYPETRNGFKLLLEKKYLRKVPLDPWGNLFQYVKVSEESIEIISFGSDGKKGGSGTASDIYVKDYKK